MTSTDSLRPRVGVAAFSSPLEMGADQAPAAAEGLARLLEELGCEVVALGSVDDAEKAVAAGRRCAEEHVDAIACAAVSWYEDYLALDLLEECPAPILLWSLPGMETGALCGTQQLTAFLKPLGHAYGCVFGALEDAGCRARAQVYLRAAALKRRLRRARIGLAGQRIGGMTHTSPCEVALKKAVGPRVVPLDLPGLLARAGEMPAEEARSLWDDVVRRAGTCRVPEEEGLDSMRAYLAVRELVREHRLDALTIGCYPHLMGRVCLAASLLADEGIPLACEGDVNGAVGQLLLSLLTGQPTHNTDWLNPLVRGAADTPIGGAHGVRGAVHAQEPPGFPPQAVEDGSVVFTHCGSGSFRLAEKQADITLAGVRLMHQGVCALFPARPGPVTLVALNASGDGYQCALLEGEAIPTEMVFPGNPLRVRFARPVADLIDWIHAEGIGHHWMAGCGHAGAEIRAWATMAGPALRLLEAR